MSREASLAPTQNPRPETMRTLSPLTLFISVMTAVVYRSEAGAAHDCSNCTATYMKAVAAPNGGDTNCTKLKVYLNCLEKNVTSAECILSNGNAEAIKKAQCTPHLTKPCSCQREFWGSALGGAKACGPLNTYISCLTAAKDNDTCKTGVKASQLKAKHLGIHTSLSCTSPNDACKGQTCSGHGKCTLNATLPAEVFCKCNDGYEGDQCQNTSPDDACKGQTCSGHGKCTLNVTLPAKVVCKCNDGYEGDQCQNTGASKDISLLSLMATLLATNILRMTLT